MLSQFRCDTPSLRVYRGTGRTRTCSPDYLIITQKSKHHEKTSGAPSAQCRSPPLSSQTAKGRLTNYATLHFAIFLYFRGSRSFFLFGERQ